MEVRRSRGHFAVSGNDARNVGAVSAHVGSAVTVRHEADLGNDTVVVIDHVAEVLVGPDAAVDYGNSHAVSAQPELLDGRVGHTRTTREFVAFLNGNVSRKVLYEVQRRQRTDVSRRHADRGRLDDWKVAVDVAAERLNLRHLRGRRNAVEFDDNRGPAGRLGGRVLARQE